MPTKTKGQVKIPNKQSDNQIDPMGTCAPSRCQFFLRLRLQRAQIGKSHIHIYILGATPAAAALAVATWPLRRSFWHFGSTLGYHFGIFGPRLKIDKNQTRAPNHEASVPMARRYRARRCRHIFGERIVFSCHFWSINSECIS